MKRIMLLIIVCLFIGTLHSQQVFYDGSRDAHEAWGWPNSWQWLFDTLESHGAEVHHFLEIDDLTDADMIFIATPYIPYQFIWKREIANFCKNGGRVVIFDANITEPDIINGLLEFDGWKTTLSIADSFNYAGGENGDTVHCISSFGLTQTLNPTDTVLVCYVRRLRCGPNSFPFAFVGPNCSTPIAAISYPFLDEGNCSSYIVVVTSCECFEREWPFIFPSGGIRFASNILLTAAGVLGYELEPGAIPGGGNACELAQQEYSCTRVPNPFTPNGDGKNDFVQFTFDGIGEKAAMLRIYDLHSNEVRAIKIPTGATAKSAARWDGRDNDGNALTEGLYLYTIECEGEIVCDGSVVIAR